MIVKYEPQQTVIVRTVKKPLEDSTERVYDSNYVYIEARVEEIRIKEGDTWIAHKIEYKLRRVRRIPYWYGDPLLDKADNFVVDGIIKEQGEEKWFREGDVYKDMEDVVKRTDVDKLLNRYRYL